MVVVTRHHVQIQNHLDFYRCAFSLKGIVRQWILAYSRMVSGLFTINHWWKCEESLWYQAICFLALQDIINTVVFVLKLDVKFLHWDCGMVI